MSKLRVGVFKFSSCDGCQLAFLNMGENLFRVLEYVEFVHFLEMGVENDNATLDVAFVEGSISTPDDLQRILRIRENSRYLISMGACATSGGIQALKNLYENEDWKASLYAQPQFIHSLQRIDALDEHVHVDHHLWGCPISTGSVLQLLASIQHGVLPRPSAEVVCMECKRKGQECVLVSRKRPCMGPVTRAGCGALCPSVGRECYACYGPAEQANTQAMQQVFTSLGVSKRESAQRFHFLTSHIEPFTSAGQGRHRDE